MHFHNYNFKYVLSFFPVLVNERTNFCNFSEILFLLFEKEIITFFFLLNFDFIYWETPYHRVGGLGLISSKTNIFPHILGNSLLFLPFSRNLHLTLQFHPHVHRYVAFLWLNFHQLLFWLHKALNCLF